MPWSIQCGWDDVPHISDAEKARRMKSIPPYQRDARTKGIPRLGAGAIYPLLEDDIICDPIARPDWWMVGYGFDVGWKATAAAQAWWDTQNDIIYIAHEYKRGEAEPAVHSSAIRAWDKALGSQLIGACDPAARGRSQKDGERLIEDYKAEGLRLRLADNAVEAGLHECYVRFTEGRLKIFSTCTQTLAELRVYHRDLKGKVIKKRDHLMDCIRYVVMTRQRVMASPSRAFNQRRVIGSMGVRVHA